jgi:hypothetical protein
MTSLGIAACGTESPEQARHRAQLEDLAVVLRYCSYGSVSRAQAKGCTAHTDVREVLVRSVGRNATNAARYAVGNITECRTDAGPACAPGETLNETEAILEDLDARSNGH